MRLSSIEEKVIQVEAFYSALDKELSAFRQTAGYGCVSGCSRCCQAPSVEATILEFLPLAFHLYKENTAVGMYDALSKNTSSLCALYEPVFAASRKGACSDYTYRALICRLFGFSFTRDKTGQPVLLTCNEIKTEHAAAHEVVSAKASEGAHVPLATAYFNQLTDIDYSLTRRQYPINEAMRLAIELVLTHFHYSEPLGEEQKTAS